MDRKVEVEFDQFGWEALTEQARREGVSIGELVFHAAMYYLADADRGRFAHRVPRAPRTPDPSLSGEESRRRV
jgi:hypothetical protein